MSRRAQQQLPFGPVRNSELFANHWLDRRLRDEPEWAAHRSAAEACLDAIAELWRHQGRTIQSGASEAEVEQSWIRPALEAMGWSVLARAPVHGRVPDLSLFLDGETRDRAASGGISHPDFWKHPHIVADAKAWGVSLDRPSRGGGMREYPPEQIEWYISRTGLSWGMLTNGRLWRLIPGALHSDQKRFQTYLEIDLPLMLDRWAAGDGTQRARSPETLDEWLRWYLLAGPVGFRTPPSAPPLMERALRGSGEYRLGVGESLREQVFTALRLCIDGFFAHAPNRLDRASDLEVCRENSFTLLFRLLFILYAEDRDLLPYRRNSTYRKNRSLTMLHNEHLRGGDINASLVRPAATGIWDSWAGLFDLIDSGHRAYGVTAYNGGMFDQEKHPFLREKVLPDTFAIQVLDKLRRTIDPKRPDEQPFNVDYRDLDIRHLGNIYEGLLELRPAFATVRMRADRRRTRDGLTERIVEDSEPAQRGWEVIEVYQPGNVVLRTDKGERRASGSYYTPDHIVNEIVERTLGPLCQEVDERLEAEIDEARREGREQDIARLEGEYDDRVLSLCVVDPSMGSGHFLIRACQYLAEQIATNPRSADPAEPADGGDEPTLVFWKRRVVEHCLFGVDRNAIAVELAKLALWLETVSAEQPLTFLDHHLRHGDSLIGARLAVAGALPDAPEMHTSAYADRVQQRLPTILAPLEQISATPSDNVRQVRDKERNRQAFERAIEPFRQIAHLWCSTFFSPTGERITPEQYHATTAALQKATDWRRVVDEPWFRRATDRAKAGFCFHWELEFPEVFLAPTRVEARRAGFDAVIGNPPWEVLSELESGHDLSALRAMIETEPVYEPSSGGKNNLYKLFICRSLGILADGGRFGFIVPMALLGDMQAEGVRRAMLERGAFTSIDTFPQKDDPSRRVFAEAKLASAVFSYVTSSDPSVREAPFVWRHHPAGVFDEAAPSLSLSRAAIPLYDPTNLSIVSCSQADWDLAVQIMCSGRLARLGDFAEFFQGEVNETNERKRGTIGYEAVDGRRVTRGAGVCLYIIRPASQGRDFYVNAARFTEAKGADTKAFHHQYRRVALQESSPQNNFRRIIASLLPAGEFCNHTINYLPEPCSRLPLELVLAVLNSKLADWYFRLGSTNAHVSHYQIYNLPCPLFATERTDEDERVAARFASAVAAGDIDAAFALLAPCLTRPPFSLAVQDVLVHLVRRIIPLESARGDIPRTARSRLSPQAQAHQDLIDRILFSAAGLSEPEAEALVRRLALML